MSLHLLAQTPRIAITAGILFLLLKGANQADGAQQVGAHTAFITVEAETGLLGGNAQVHSYTVFENEPKWPTLVNEASRGAYVELSAVGSAVGLKNPVAGADAIVVRFSVPPSDVSPHYGTEGTLDLHVDGQFRQAITLHSKNAYVYRTPGKSNKPFDSEQLLRRYNEFRFKLEGAPLEQGSVLTLRKGPKNLLDVYNIDLVDFEKMDPPRVRPEGSLSVMDFGAIGDGMADDTQAFQTAADAASEAGKVLWIPEGVFLTSYEKSGQLRFTDVEVRGAGIWYTTLLRKPPVGMKRKHRTSIVVRGKSVLSDVYIRNEAYYEGDYAVLSRGTGWLVERVWSHNTGPFWMSGTDGLIRDCRASDHWGDGININNSNRNSPETLGYRLTVRNNFIRNPGDDGLAHFSDADSGDGGRENSMMQDCIIENNTVIAPWWANCLRVAGGKNLTVRNNYLRDSAPSHTMHVGTFGGNGQPLESAIIEGNVLGSSRAWEKHKAPADAMNISYRGYNEGQVIVRNNIIEHSHGSGIRVSASNANLKIYDNVISNVAEYGIVQRSNAYGNIQYENNQVNGLREGQAAFHAMEPYTTFSQFNANDALLDSWKPFFPGMPWVVHQSPYSRWMFDIDKIEAIDLQKSTWRNIIESDAPAPLIVMGQRGDEINYEGSWSIDYVERVIEWTKKQLAGGATMLVITDHGDPLTRPKGYTRSIGLRLSGNSVGERATVEFIDSPHIHLSTWEAESRSRFWSKLMRAEDYADSEQYLSIARVKDDTGEYLGDAIAVVELGGELRGGTLIYVADFLYYYPNRANLLDAVFKLVRRSVSQAVQPSTESAAVHDHAN
ncbi:MAG: right-handed parallel beta-helix repeat-containing protein [Opitutales bacterium]